MMSRDDPTDRQVRPSAGDRQIADVADHKGPSDASSTGAAANADVAELVRLTTVSVLSERIKLLGIDRSGAYEHYNLRLGMGFPIGRGELAVFKFIRDRMPNLRSYHEIG